MYEIFYLHIPDVLGWEGGRGTHPMSRVLPLSQLGQHILLDGAILPSGSHMQRTRPGT